MEEEIQTHEYYNAIHNDINKRIEKYQKDLETYEERKNQTGSEKLGVFDRFINNRDIKRAKSTLTSYGELKKQLSNVHFSDNEGINFSQETITEIDDLCDYLTEDETIEISQLLNAAKTEANEAKNVEIEKQFKTIREIAQKLDILGRKVSVGDDAVYRGHYTYETIISKLESKSIIHTKYISIDKNRSIPKFEPEIVTTVNQLFQSGELNSSNKVVKNLDKINEKLIIKENSEKVVEYIKTVLSKLSEEKELDVVKIVKYLYTLSDKYEKEIFKAQKFIEQFDLASIEKKAEEKEVANKKDEYKNNKAKEYEQLAYELAKIKDQNPQDTASSSKIVEQMRLLEIQSGLSKIELDKLSMDGNVRYFNEKKEIKEKGEEAQRKAHYEEQLEKDALYEIREEAIRQLKSSGAFDESLEYRNGDMHTRDINKEKLIQDKIEELKKYAEMTPEQRGLQDLKKHGVVPANATIADLTYDQLNDIRIGYADSTVTYMNSYKKWQEREKAKARADQTYQEYMNYIGSLENKGDGMTFEEFAAEHNVNSITTSDVSPDLKEEMKEVASRSR